MKRRFPRGKLRALFLCLILLASCCHLTAQSSPATPADRIAQLELQVKNAQSSADNAWMLVSAALVLLMTGPGLALFYGGLVRKKNVLATMLQSFAMMALMTVTWAMVGHSLSFGEGHRSN